MEKAYRSTSELSQYEAVTESQLQLLHYLLEAAVQAPSWYNSQPWLFQIKDSSIQVYLNPDADQSLFDYNNINSTIACGATVENIMIAAQAKDLSPRLTVLPDSTEQADLIATINLDFDKEVRDEDSGEHNLESSIWSRHTNTLMYQSTPLQSSVQSSLLQSVSHFKQTKLYLVDSDKDKHIVFNAYSKADIIRFSRHDLHTRLYKIIRWNDIKAQQDKTGFTPASMGLCGIGEKLFQLTRSWYLMRFLNIFGMADNFAQRANEGLLHCSAIGLITVKGIDSGHLVEAGRAMQRLWLTANSMGLALQPLNSLLLFNCIKQDSKSSAFDAKEKKIIDQAMQSLSDSFSALNTDNNHEIGAFLFRVGIGESVQGFSLRESVKIKQ